MKILDQLSYDRGVLAAAAVAGEYDGCSTHRYRLEDCVGQRLNASPRKKPRLNKKRLKDPRDVATVAFSKVLADLWRSFHEGEVVREIARVEGITLKVARAAGADFHDVLALRQAGVAAGPSLGKRVAW
jgi:hypothetical protein